ncbi:MAG: hypothetical protein HYY84_15690 [Deltaproteobacteria bacterium]|nr:hypothetical protein [Deltaproteobacteria bacterium]
MVAKILSLVTAVVVAFGGLLGLRGDAAAAPPECERVKVAPAKQTGGPTLKNVAFGSCVAETLCGDAGRVCTWTFGATGKKLPSTKHDAYKRTFLVLAGGTSVAPYDNAAPNKGTYTVKGCFMQTSGAVESAVYLKNTDGKRSAAVCLKGSIEGATQSGGATTTPPPPVPPAPEALPNDADRQKWIILNAFTNGVKNYIIKYPSAVADYYSNGSLSNLNESFKALFQYGKALGEGENYERGCVAMQGATMSAINDTMKRPGILWTAKRLVVGNVFEHHAVALFLTGKTKESGFVIDPWVAQTHEITKAFFTWDEWLSKMWKLKVLKGPRFED